MKAFSEDLQLSFLFSKSESDKYASPREFFILDWSAKCCVEIASKAL